MSEWANQKYLVRDMQGNVYGPANAELLREWVGQGRIVAGMHIAPQETREWVEVSQHPALADLLGGAGPGQVSAASQQVPVQSVPVEVQPWGGPGTTAGGGGPLPSVGYAPVERSRVNIFSRLSMIGGILSPCVFVGGCIPFCGCVCLPGGVVLALVAIILGIIGFATNAPDQPGGKRDAIIGIGGAGITLVLLVALMLIGIMAPAPRPIPIAPGPVPVAPLPAPAPAPGPEAAPVVEPERVP